jgi:hypothetical protein
VPVDTARTDYKPGDNEEGKESIESDLQKVTTIEEAVKKIEPLEFERKEEKGIESLHKDFFDIVINLCCFKPFLKNKTYN